MRMDRHHLVTAMICLCAALWMITFVLHCVSGLREPWKMAAFGFLAMMWTGIAVWHVIRRSLHARKER